MNRKKFAKRKGEGFDDEFMKALAEEGYFEEFFGAKPVLKNQKRRSGMKKQSSKRKKNRSKIQNPLKDSSPGAVQSKPKEQSHEGCCGRHTCS